MRTMTPRRTHAPAQSLRLELSEELRRHFPGREAFDGIISLPGAVYRDHKNRRTTRVQIGERDFFLKVHGPTPWREILKNALRGRWPVLTAQTEAAAVRRVTQLGVPTVRTAGWGCRGRWPAGMESFIVTEALHRTQPLDEAARDWLDLPRRERVALQRSAIDEVARIARTLHTNGLNHRDFYLNHFLVELRDWSRWNGSPLTLYVIDLHRMQIRGRTPHRWVKKDLAGLLFSSFDLELSSRDVLRFLRAYWGEGWRARLRRSRRPLRQIARRAVRLYQDERRKPPPVPAGLASFARIERDPSPGRA